MTLNTEYFYFDVLGGICQGAAALPLQKSILWGNAVGGLPRRHRIWFCGIEAFPKNLLSEVSDI